MVRRFVVISVVMFATLGVVIVGSAAERPGSVKVTFTRAVRPTPPGSQVAIGWKLRDASGHVVLDKHVFVKITCPEGDATTTTYASPQSHGVYLVNALVPPGGIGTIKVGHGTTIFPITNPYHG
jgi:hypothetical protein